MWARLLDGAGHAPPQSSAPAGAQVPGIWPPLWGPRAGACGGGPGAHGEGKLLVRPVVSGPHVLSVPGGLGAFLGVGVGFYQLLLSVCCAVCNKLLRGFLLKPSSYSLLG